MNKNLINDLFGIEGLDIAWYGVLICLGIVAGAVTALLLAKKRGYKSDVVIDYLLLALPLAVIGVKCVRSLIGQVFANNKIMGVLCIAIILMSPFTMLALSGCYAIFADYLRAYFEKKRSERQ